MLTFLAILHVFIGIALVVFVLLQDPKDGAGMLGGSSGSKSFFGASGAEDFLSTTTKWLGVAFACTCLILTTMTTKHGTSVLDDATAAPQAPATGTAPVAAPTAPADKQTAPPAAAPQAPAAPAAPNAPKHE